ncbi:MAG: hypothetical protein PUC65_11160 [Clostridiales bacterium]|nr:hypothetical protein [Clostridiales bacterium]
MKKENLLLQFLAGIVLFGLGLFWFCSQVNVSTGFGYRFGDVQINGGLVVVPFLIGVVWSFFDSKSIVPKIIMILGILFIIGAVVVNTKFTLVQQSLFTYLLMLVLICSGLGLIAKVLFKGSKDDK